MCKMISFCQLILIGALTWSVAVSTKLVGAKKSEFHMMLENNWPDPDPSINHFPHETSCHHYYLVLSEEDISIKKCPNGKLFDYFVHRCIEKESARCWSRRFSEIIHDHNHVHKAPKRFKCPYATGKFPDITDCARYYQCLSGIAKIKKCAPFEYFDKIKRKCIAEIKAVCADETDVVEHGYKCPRHQGLFSFSKDCSKYYECIDKRPDLKTCPKYRVFDEKKRMCISSEVVHCGSRYNPYEDLKVSSEPTTDSLQEQTDTVTDQKVMVETALPKTDSTNKPLLSVSNENDLPITSSIFADKVTKKVKPIPIKEFDSSENDISKESQESSEDRHKVDLKESKESSEESNEHNSKETRKDYHEDNSKESKETTREDNSKESTEDNDLESSIINEFVTPIKILSSDEISTRQEIVTESNRVTSTESHPITKDDKTCHPKDVTCIRDGNRIIRCPAATGFFPHPKDQRRFLHCFNFNIYVKTCPEKLFFQDSLRACVRPLDQVEKNG